MNIFGIGLPEIAVVAGIALVIFGPKRLPELGKTLGKTLKGLQKASSEFENEIQNAMSEDNNENIKNTTDDESNKE